MSKVLYICMPFASVSWGSLALSTLKAIGKQAGIDSDIRYLNIPFVLALGESRYNTLRELIDSEICFTSSLFPEIEPISVWQRYLALYRGPKDSDGKLAQSAAEFLEIAGHCVPDLLRLAIEEIPWDDYDIVGFTTGYHQLTASLAMARQIRNRFPEKTIIFGGASCDGEMGPSLVEHFDMVDAVVSGEADDVIVPLIQALRNGTSLAGLPKVHARSVLAEGRGPQAAPVAARDIGPGLDMDALPTPDYDDYFAQVAYAHIEDDIRIPFESSRGCWWGQKHLCTFCGLNGTSLPYRVKSPERVLSEIKSQFLRYGQQRFMAVDNIFDMAYFKTFLPGLKALHKEFGLTVFYETKSNLKHDQIRALVEAGITEVQPGIESFSDNVLKLMDKGTTGCNQIRFLRDCAGCGLETRYGILWGNPGETVEDYSRMTDLIPFIRHLPPPKYIVPVILQRFSPYFLTPEKFGIRNVRPAGIYEVLFGGYPIDYMKLAYNFSYDHDSDIDESLCSSVEELILAVEGWRSSYQPYALLSSEVDGTLYIADRRNTEPFVFRLSGLEKAIFDFCESPRSEAEIQNRFPETPTEWLRQFLDQMIGNHLQLAWRSERSQKYLSLPVRVPPAVLYNKVLKQCRASL